MLVILMNRQHKKAISPLLAAVILISIVIGIGIFLSSSFNSIFKQKISTTTAQEKCSSGGGLQIIYSGCSSNVIKTTITNSKKADLTNFSIFAEINGNTYVNNTPLNGNTFLTPGAIVNLEAATTYSGEISKLRISAGGDCPGVYIEINNETTDIGTC